MKIVHETIVAEKLKTVLERMKWTQASLAELLGVGQKTMSFWVRDKKKPSAENRQKINLVYNMVTRGDLDGKPEALALARAEMSTYRNDEPKTESKLTVKEYFEAKNFVREQEKDNLSKIYLFPSTGKAQDYWYKVAGKSLLYYKFFLAERLGRQVTTRTDTDSQCIFKYGVGSVRRGDMVIPQATKLGYKVEKLDNGVIVIDLGREFEPKEIDNFIEQERAERQAVENIVKPKYNYPRLAAAIRMLAEYLPQKIEKISKDNRGTIGRQLLEPAIELVKFYHRMANGDIDKVDARQNMLCRVDDIAAVITFMDAGRILDLKARVRLGENVMDIRHQIEDTL